MTHTADLGSRLQDAHPSLPVVLVGEARLPTTSGTFRALAYRQADGVEYLALVTGDLGDGHDVLVRLHSECLTGDVLGSLRCDCGPQLHAALEAITAEGRGVVLYLRGQEGRGIGLAEKIAAYALQEQGRDTVEANVDLGLPVDARDYTGAVAVLRDLGVRDVELMTHNPVKVRALEAHGVPVLRRRDLPVAQTVDNLRYLRTKRDRMGHELPGVD
ncbi:GTP cyclohydrolase II [Kineococcus rhizosphaerae]|uniref:GTP cyclohydrolase-2 n=1 Tax=Kineococcus rhizosphaerae TaxID=559628 RepID=A0A2T0R9L6_9ACTN|nr:GTP cyclohydrolase II [Kineococcus rhizosphaerae]PRY17844.1 GTP cyclohydrolase II [Kineococcus rhizosphaerae]